MLTLLCTGERREWFVSEAGNDSITCGTTQLTACRRLDRVAIAARPGDVLRLDPASATYRLPCARPDHGFGVQSLTIAAVNTSGRPTIGCQKTPATAKPANRCALSLDNVTMIGVDLEVDDCHVTVSNSYLRDSTIYSTRRCRSLRVRVTQTNWTFSGHLPYHSHIENETSLGSVT